MATVRGLTFALMLGVVVSTAPTITVRVNPNISTAPASVKVTIQVEPADTNRRLCLEYDGGDFSKSCWDIDGSSPRTFHRLLRNLSAGEYQIRATVVRADNSTSVAVTQVVITEGSPQ